MPYMYYWLLSAFQLTQFDLYYGCAMLTCDKMKRNTKAVGDINVLYDKSNITMIIYIVFIVDFCIFSQDQRQRQE